MATVIIYPQWISIDEIRQLLSSKARITIQFRVYDENGIYDKDASLDKGTETLMIKGTSLSEAHEIVKASLLSSKLVNTKFDVMHGKRWMTSNEQEEHEENSSS